MADNGFEIKDNKAEIMAGDLSSAGGWTVVQAVEVAPPLPSQRESCQLTPYLPD